jgi:hypothetical protein
MFSAISLKKIGYGTHSDPKFGQRWGSFSYVDARKKVPECRSGLRHSEKELPERRTGAFRHKNTPADDDI